jgi:hypothetical protein
LDYFQIILLYIFNSRKTNMKKLLTLAAIALSFTSSVSFAQEAAAPAPAPVELSKPTTAMDNAISAPSKENAQNAPHDVAPKATAHKKSAHKKGSKHKKHKGHKKHRKAA